MTHSGSLAGSNGIALNDAVSEMLEEDPDSARSYVFYRWFSELMERIREERELQGLTQHDLAERLNTTQSSIARMENDRQGRVTVRRLWEYAFAVGLAPLAEVRPASGLLGFVQQHPDASLTATEYDEWMVGQKYHETIATGLAAAVARYQETTRAITSGLQAIAQSQVAASEAIHSAMKTGLANAMQTWYPASFLEKTGSIGEISTAIGSPEQAPMAPDTASLRTGTSGFGIGDSQKWAA
jgi:transcriptional regulator with XRE-family HTH domain